MMLLALTVERYVSVCHPGRHTRPLCGPPHLTVVLIPLATFLVYLPSVFRGEITTCLLEPGGPLIYQKRENQSFLNSWYYQVICAPLQMSRFSAFQKTIPKKSYLTIDNNVINFSLYNYNCIDIYIKCSTNRIGKNI